jgi:Fur family peroxide stress response transcriptional regulator
MASSAQVEARVDEVVRKLRANGQRLTPQRLALLRALVSNPHHPSAEQVYREVRPLYPMMSLATVYKTIDMLKELGEIHELEFRDGANRYDANIPSPHAHLVCTQCGRIQDVDVGELGALTAEVGALTGYASVRLRLDFYGLCPTCRAASESAS